MAANQLKAAFNRFDLSGGGVISKDELAAVMKQLDPKAYSDPNKIDKLMKKMDTNHDGGVSYHEFVDWVMGDSEAAEEAVPRWPVDGGVFKLKEIRYAKMWMKFGKGDPEQHWIDVDGHKSNAMPLILRAVPGKPNQFKLFNKHVSFPNTWASCTNDSSEWLKLESSEADAMAVEFISAGEGAYYMKNASRGTYREVHHYKPEESYFSLTYGGDKGHPWGVTRSCYNVGGALKVTLHDDNVFANTTFKMFMPAHNVWLGMKDDHWWLFNVKKEDAVPINFQAVSGSKNTYKLAWEGYADGYSMGDNEDREWLNNASEDNAMPIEFISLEDGSYIMRNVSPGKDPANSYISYTYGAGGPHSWGSMRSQYDEKSAVKVTFH